MSDERGWRYIGFKDNGARLEDSSMKFSERYGYVKPVEVLKRGYLDNI